MIIKSQKHILDNCIKYFFLILIALILVMPYGFMINRSLMSNDYILQPEMHYWSDGLNFSNYAKAFSDGGYGRPMINTFIVCIIVGISTPFVSFLPAYAFAKLNWIGKGVAFGVMMFTSLIPGIVTQVPMYVLYNDLGITNTLFPMFLPGLFFAGAMNVFLCRQFLMSVPKEMEESAKLDGANSFVRCFAICAPLCVPIMVYIGVSAVMGSWGDYLTLSMYNNKTEAPQTLAFALYQMTGKDTNSTHPEWIFAAAAVLSIVPTILFSVFQKYLIEGMQTAGIKG